MPLRPLRHDLLKPHQDVSRVSFTTEGDPGLDASLLPEPDHFETIDELIAWKWEGGQGDVDTAHASVGATAAQIRPEFRKSSTSSDESRLLVCHDFKGGYTEDPFERGYSFEFWHLVDNFIYFSHKRITLPPRGWMDAGHRHGCKILGTVIFEWAESKPDLVKCLYGSRVFNSDTDPETGILPFSTACASQLIKLAKHRNFDGYLINIETNLNFLPPASCYPLKSREERDEDAASMGRESNLAGLEALISSDIRQRRERRMVRNATVLASWVGWLKEEGKRLVGPHWEVIWYDSVTTAGRLEWQDALTQANAPFFKNSDAILTNYTWARPPDPAPPGQLPDLPLPPLKHHPLLLMSAQVARSMSRSTADVYMGIDVFGRNCYGGYEIGRSLDLIFPSSNRSKPDHSPRPISEDTLNGRSDLGLSVALFAPGWTWERETPDGRGQRSWTEWWADDLRFWFGRGATESPPGGSRDNINAVSKYFGPRARHLVSSSSPLLLHSESRTNGQNTAPDTFYTNFCLGSGKSWWVGGRKVYDASSPLPDPFGRLGWTDIESCFPKPDRIWPRVVSLHLDDINRTEKSTTQTKGITCALRRALSNDWVVNRAEMVDYEAWQGGSSLEIVLRPQNSTSPTYGPVSSMVILPLCTLNACHISPLLQGQTLSLEMVVKHHSDPAGSLNLHDHLQFQPYLIWASDEPSEECTYHLPLLSPSTINSCALSNGWYRTQTTLYLKDMNVLQLSSTGAVVPVVSLGIHTPPRDTGEDALRILVGEIHLSALSPLRQVSPTSQSPSANTTTLQSSGRRVHWKRVPAPRAASPTSLWGILTWSDEPRTQSSDIRGAEDSLTSLSGYFNIFASASRKEKTQDNEHEYDSSDVWLGTSTYGHNANSFIVAGLEPSDILSKSSNRLVREQNTITFSVDRVGGSERVAYGSTEGTEPLCSIGRRLEIDVSLI